MSGLEEKPAGGGEWMGNALVYERSRVESMTIVEKLERGGFHEEAAEWRERAAQATRERDRAQREEERRAMNRSLASRRRYY